MNVKMLASMLQGKLSQDEIKAYMENVFALEEAVDYFSERIALQVAAFMHPLEQDIKAIREELSAIRRDIEALKRKLGVEP